jgi:hypothetical protein
MFCPCLLIHPVSADSGGSITTVRVSLAAAFLVLVAISADAPQLRADWLGLTSARAVDPIAEQERAYKALIDWLPQTGRIGYKPSADWPSDRAVLRFFVAEYALTPRLVVTDLTPEFIIVDPGAPASLDNAPAISISSDPGLPGFALYRKAESGLRVFRRVK